MSVSSETGFKNRSGLEILASIVSATAGGARKTHVMYKANLSHSQLQRYLAFLESRGLVKITDSPDSSGQIYEATEKGMHFLKDYMRLDKYLNSLAGEETFQ
ncbi:MAG: winged helix-turn-helix domain-containing protein [Thermoproteota archaeon]